MQSPSHRTVALAACLATALVLLQSPALAQYERTNLVSDQKENALHRDQVLKNAWGLAFASTSPIWTSDNDTGLSTLYDGHGNKQGLTVTVPPASGNGKGSPTGIVFNGSPDFVVTAGGFTGPSVFLFAVLAFAVGVVSFPLLLDRDVGMATALTTSLRAVGANLGVMALWGAIVAGALVLGSAPALVGLIFVMPLLGHATWHLYRKLIA